MITFNQFGSYPCFSGIQRVQRENKEKKPVLRQLQHDTVEFSGLSSFISSIFKPSTKPVLTGQEKFLKLMEKFRKDPVGIFDSSLSWKVGAYAEYADPAHPEVKAVIEDVMKNEPDPFKKAWILKDVVQNLGKSLQLNKTN